MCLKPVGTPSAHPDVQPATSQLSMSKFATVADYEAARAAQVGTVIDEGAKVQPVPAMDWLMDWEHQRAIMESERNASADAYFDARSQIDHYQHRKIFEDAFQRGFQARHTSPQLTQPVQTQDEPVAKLGKGPSGISFTHLTDHGRTLPPGKYDLYTRPQAVAAMSDEEITKCWNEFKVNARPREFVPVSFARSLGVPVKGE